MSSNAAVLAELRALRLDLAELSARVLALEEARDSQVESVGSSQVTVNYCVAGSSRELRVGPFPESVAADQEPAAPAGSSRTTGLPRTGAAAYTDEERRAIAEAAGLFVRRALNGDYRGTSGREQLRLQSRVYLLFRDHSGNLYDPVRIFDSYAAINPLVKPRGDLGDSVFIGFPSRWEGRVCAGVAWPLNG